METSKKTMSPAAAIAIGTVVVNVPVAAILIGISLIGVQLGLSLTLALVLALVLGWSWWSLAVPRWRLWAYQRVASTGVLQKWALSTGLVWPRGSFLERTEFKSSAHRQLEKELEQQFP
jgi:hypothetical protein